MNITVIVGLGSLLTPGVALACATCISSPFGNQSYNWPYLGLILLPFGLIVMIAGILGYHAYFGAKEDSQIIKETT
jgi:hypothetical protein